MFKDDFNACTKDYCDPLLGCVNEIIPCPLPDDNCTISSCNSLIGCVYHFHFYLFVIFLFYYYRYTTKECTPIDKCHTTACDLIVGCLQIQINGTINCQQCAPSDINCRM